MLCPAMPAEGDITAAESKSGQRHRRLRPWQLILMPVLLILLTVVALVIGESFVEPQITVSRETTYFIEPLDEKGHVDYAGALNRKGSAGVTPVNNAAVLLARAALPAGLTGEVRSKFHEYGIEFPRSGEAFFKEFTGKDAAEELKRTEPWTADENPALAAWIESQEAPFEIAEEASQRSRYFEPVARDLLWSGFLADEVLKLSRGLACRAALRLGEGDAAAAWADLHTVLRLSRLAGAWQSTSSIIIAMAMHNRAVNGTLVLVRSSLITEQLAMQMLQDLREVAPLPRTIDAHEFERCSHLKIVQSALRDRHNFVSIEHGRDNPACMVPFWLTRRAVNFDDVMERSNEWHDRWQAIAANPSRTGRRAALQLFWHDLQDTRVDALAAAGLRGSHEMADSVMRSIGTGGLLHIRGDDASCALWTVLQAQLATRLWQMRHGSDPAKLEDLVPDLLPVPPIDPFSEMPLKYLHVGDELRIYSLWLNGVDDGGERVEEQGGKDDLTASLKSQAILQPTNP